MNDRWLMGAILLRLAKSASREANFMDNLLFLVYSLDNKTRKENFTFDYCMMRHFTAALVTVLVAGKLPADKEQGKVYFCK